jgi:hypothetical protein
MCSRTDVSQILKQRTMGGSQDPSALPLSSDRNCGTYNQLYDFDLKDSRLAVPRVRRTEQIVIDPWRPNVM